MSSSTDQPGFAFPKQKPIRDPALVSEVRRFPCLACTPGRQLHRTEAHHVTTRGAGGGDVPNNLMPLCTLHHKSWHDMGPQYMVRTFPRVKSWLVYWDRTDILSGKSG